MSLALPRYDKVSTIVSDIAENEHSFFLHPLGMVELECFVTELKDGKLSGRDGLSAEIVKSSLAVLREPLLYMFNRSLSEGVFPECLKRANVFPLHKNGSKMKIDNYRSLSILPVLSKLLEKVVFARLECFFLKFKIFYPKQFGFRSKYSTNHALAHITEKLRENPGFEYVSILLDLRKAFDTVNHTRLFIEIDYSV